MKPIIFEKDEVREILAFRKITVERPVKVEPAIRILDKDNPSPEHNKILIGRTPTDERIEVHPPFTVGEGVYVCEEWLDNSKQSFPEAYLYKIDASSVAWQPAETMPKEAARIFLRVKSVKPYKKFDDYWFWVFEFEKVSKTRAEKTMEEEYEEAKKILDEAIEQGARYGKRYKNENLKMRTNYDWLSNLKPEQLALILDQAQDIGTEEDGRMDPVQWLIWLQDEADPMFFYNKSIDIFL